MLSGPLVLLYIRTTRGAPFFFFFFPCSRRRVVHHSTYVVSPSPRRRKSSARRRSQAPLFLCCLHTHAMWFCFRETVVVLEASKHVCMWLHVVHSSRWRIIPQLGGLLHMWSAGDFFQRAATPPNPAPDRFCRTLPDDVDTPLRWLVDVADEEFRLLDGTMVGLLSGMMHSQVCNSLPSRQQTFHSALGAFFFLYGLCMVQYSFIIVGARRYENSHEKKRLKRSRKTRNTG